MRNVVVASCFIVSLLLTAQAPAQTPEAIPDICERSYVTRAGLLKKYSDRGVYCISQGEARAERMSFFGDPAIQTFDEHFDCMHMRSGDRFAVTFMDERVVKSEAITTSCGPFKAFIERRGNPILQMQDFEEGDLVRNADRP